MDPNQMMNNMMGNGQGFMMNNNNNNNMMMNPMMMNNNMNNAQFNNNMVNNFNMNNMANFMNNNMNNNMNNINMNNLNPMALQAMYNFMLMMNPNINVNNPMNVNNNLMNFINTNPLFFQYFMNQSNFNNNMNNNNNNNNSFNFFKGDISKAKIGILPRPDANDNKAKSVFICPNTTGERINIMFITGAGLKTMVVAPINLPVKDLFKEYIKKMGQDPGVLGKYIYFLYNGLKIDLNEPKTVCQYGLNASNVIMVVDTSNLLGGFF